MPSINLKLHGEFKVDIFNSDGELKRSSNYVKNFITNSGALYPYYFAFADCFRYLSLGIGTGINSTGLSIAPTTGLVTGVPAFSYLGTGNYVTGGYLGGGCGNFADPNSNTISLIRQWSIPDISGNVLQASYPFSEIMVSPGRPYVTGWSSNNSFTAIATGACLCSEGGVYSLDNGSLGSPDLFGLECSPIAAYYDIVQQVQEEVNSQSMTNAGLRNRLRMCDAPYAFARITGNFNATSGEIMTVTYKLNLSFTTGVQKGLFTSANHDTNKNWAALGYVANITNPGVKLITDGNIAANISSILSPTLNRLQHIDYSIRSNWTPSYGESFIPSMGIPFEPSCIYGTNGNFIAYISDDNTQFAANSTGGACNTGLFKPWNTSGPNLPQNSGLLKFQTIISGNNSSLAISSAGGTDYWQLNPYNIRQSTSSATYPSTGDVSSPTTASPNVYISPSQSNSLFFPNSRGGTIATNYVFSNYYISSFGTYQTVKSYVLGYVDAAALQFVSGNAAGFDFTNVMPFFDCLFSGISGSTNFLPIVQNGSQDNSTSTKITNASVTGYNYLSGNAGYYYPILNNQLTWTADCPHGVDGCP